MKEYDTSEVANIVGIANPTVNKYSLALEKEGYLFTKNKRGHRIYTENDIEILEQIKIQSETTKMPVKQIVNMLISQRKGNTGESIQDVSDVITLKQNDEKIVNTIQSDERYETLLNEIQQLKEMIIQQQTYIDKKLEARDQRLMESLRATIEAKQQAQIETATAEQKQEKKSFFARLFGK